MLVEALRLACGGLGAGGGAPGENQEWLLGPGLSTRVDGRTICRDGDPCGTRGLGRGTSLCESHADVGMFRCHRAPPRGQPCPSPPRHGSLMPRTGDWTPSPEVRDARRADCPPGPCCVHSLHPHSRPGSCATPPTTVLQTRCPRPRCPCFPVFQPQGRGISQEEGLLGGDRTDRWALMVGMASCMCRVSACPNPGPVVPLTPDLLLVWPGKSGTLLWDAPVLGHQPWQGRTHGKVE